MNLVTTTRGPVLLAAVNGKLDATSSDEAENKLLKAILPETRCVVFDLSCMEYVSSAGLRVLLQVIKRLKAAGGSVRFWGLNESVKTVFDISALTLRCEIFRSQEEALKDLPN
jgi:stage II sporulation protein AA (anti-sigma F factor antagonist)